MQYLGKQVNGQATRNNFIRSMDLARTHGNVEDALEAYGSAWFSSHKKQYLNEAFKHISAGSLFWPKKAFPDMLDEIVLGAEGTRDEIKALARDADVLKSRFAVWGQPRRTKAVTKEDLVKDIKAFESAHRYACPDTYRTAWMNTGAYVTLAYGIKYEGLMFPGCATPEESLGLLKKLAMEVVADMDHDVDDRLFRMCHALYAPKAAAGVNGAATA